MVICALVWRCSATRPFKSVIAEKRRPTLQPSSERRGLEQTADHGNGNDIDGLMEARKGLVHGRHAEGTMDVGEVADLRYQRPSSEAVTAFSGETMNLDIRCKRPDGDESVLPSHVCGCRRASCGGAHRTTSGPRAWEFGMLLRASEHRGDSSLEGVLSPAAP